MQRVMESITASGCDGVEFHHKNSRPVRSTSCGRDEAEEMGSEQHTRECELDPNVFLPEGTHGSASFVYVLGAAHPSGLFTPKHAFPPAFVYAGLPRRRRASLSICGNRLQGTQAGEFLTEEENDESRNWLATRRFSFVRSSRPYAIGIAQLFSTVFIFPPQAMQVYFPGSSSPPFMMDYYQ